MSDLNQIFVPSSLPRTVEIDPSCHSVYIRFRMTRVNRTVSNSKPGTAVVAIDFDANDEIVGVELVGVREFSIAAIRHHLPQRMKQINFERARFMPVAMCAREAVPA